MRVIAIHPAATHSVDLAVSEVPRVGDRFELEGKPMVVRSLVQAAPDTGVTAFVYVVPIEDSR